MKQIVIASSNPGKLREFRALFVDRDISIVPQKEFGIGDADECGLSFVENAIIKARHAASQTNLPAIADDSGLEVDMLGGKPGIHSARYAGLGASDEQNLQLLLENIKAFADTQVSARFQCLMVYLERADDPTPIIAQGTWEGHIVKSPKGNNGFGYDPVFYLTAHKCTSAQLPADLKNKISHRAQALNLLMEKLTTLFN